jgi:hypothetical protein
MPFWHLQSLPLYDRACLCSRKTKDSAKRKSKEKLQIYYGENIPADARPVRSLLSSRAKATTAASICDVADDLTDGPMVATAWTVSPSSCSSEKPFKENYDQYSN